MTPTDKAGWRRDKHPQVPTRKEEAFFQVNDVEVVVGRFSDFRVEDI